MQKARRAFPPHFGPQGCISVNGSIPAAKPGKQPVLLTESSLGSAALPASAKCTLHPASLHPASWRGEWGICFLSS